MIKEEAAYANKRVHEINHLPASPGIPWGPAGPDFK